MRTYISETERKRGQWNRATAYYAYFLLDSYIEICKWCADQNAAIPALSLDLVLNGHPAGINTVTAVVRWCITAI